MTALQLGLAGLDYQDLFQVTGLQRLDQEFLQRLQAQNPGLHDQLLAYREQRSELTLAQQSDMLIGCGPLLEAFIAELFGIEDAAEQLQARNLSHDPIFQFKKLFVLRRARRRLLKKEPLAPFAELDAWVNQALTSAAIDNNDRELAIARLGQGFLADKEAHGDEIETMTHWCLSAMTTPEGQAAVRGWVSFHLPQGTDYAHLVPLEVVPQDKLGRVQGPPANWHRRDGFALTDPRMNRRQVQAEVDYCIYCHDHDGDFCSKGFPQKKSEPERGLKKNPLNVTLTGCPLDEKISEMHSLKRDGYSVGALAMIMVDNPMCPATGHRICNDCMKSCIYQKQEPVDIPQIETGALTDVLALPWGVEIYDLLTRWNPLRQQQWIMQAYNGKKVLIAGMGPAGFTLAHHLLMEGCAVVGIDGLKIEPLPKALQEQPIRDYGQLEEALDQRIMAGFGGVAEYGITVRWDKNFLRLIYLSLSRRQHFQVFGAIRFGGTLTVENAWELGFDHVAIAVGAGLPSALPIPGSLAPGMRQANDFLMALQLTGAAKASSLANLQVRLPAVVIGGGLTGVDTATEVQAYYIVQVEKVLQRYQTLAQHYGEAAVRADMDAESLEVLDEFLQHGRAVAAERQRAQATDEKPNFLPLIHAWGGVTIAYRRAMEESPAYTRNHEEVIKALEEGIFYAAGLNPTAASLNDYGHVKALVCQRMSKDEDGKLQASGETLQLPAHAIFVATGARPNIAYFYEHRGTFKIEQAHYQTYALEQDKLVPVATTTHCKDPNFGAFTSYDKDGRRVSFIGDTHPDFNGSVVKAVASGLRIYPKIMQAIAERPATQTTGKAYQTFRQSMQDLLQPRIDSVVRHTPSVIELRVHAPMVARRIAAGQFVRVQNYESLAPMIDGTCLQTETLALTNAGADPESGIVSVMVMERGVSSRLCAGFKPGEPLAFMGPAGVRTRIPEGKNILVVGDQLAAAAMRALGPAFRAAGNRVLYVGLLDTAADVFCQDELEAGADAILWVTRNGEALQPRRPQDMAMTAELDSALLRYAQGEFNNTDKPASLALADIDELLIIGGSKLVRQVQVARCGALRPYLKGEHKAVGSIYSSMQCMLKGVCSQCLQWQIDPATGQRTKAVFACSWQEQPIDMVDLDNLDERLGQNRLQERLGNLWLDYLLQQQPIERV